MQLKQYNWDFGINWNIPPEPVTSNLAFYRLEHYFMAFFDDNSVQQQAPYNLQSGIPMSFNIYELTDNPECPQTQSILRLMMVFNHEADSPTRHITPFTSVVLFSNQIVQDGTCFSAPFQGIFPLFTSGLSEVVQNTGRFVMQMWVTAQAMDGTIRTWIGDPEMAVGIGG